MVVDALADAAHRAGFNVNLEQLKGNLERAGLAFAPGLNSRELDLAEARFGFAFPPDLKSFLSFAIPIGKRIPNWRDLDDPYLVQAFDWPLEGLWFDVEHNSLWLPSWGPRPASSESAYERLRKLVEEAPRLIPIQGHRYLPSWPLEEGNPVLSVYQSDIILYGLNLEDYFHNEYSFSFDREGYQLSGEPKTIDFWSSFIA